MDLSNKRITPPESDTRMHWPSLVNLTEETIFRTSSVSNWPFRKSYLLTFESAQPTKIS